MQLDFCSQDIKSAHLKAGSKIIRWIWRQNPQYQTGKVHKSKIRFLYQERICSAEVTQALEKSGKSFDINVIIKMTTNSGIRI